jgi:ubiquinone biosynthesis protein
MAAMLQQILAATDGSERALKAVSFAAELAGKFNGALTLVHVRSPGGPAVPEDALQQHAFKANARLRIVDGEKPAETICELAETMGVDAIVVGNYGMSDRKEFLLGNIPNRISHNARCTVIIVDTRDEVDRKRR